MKGDNELVVAVSQYRELGGESLSDTDRSQLQVLGEAFEKFQERNAKYKDLWKEGGVSDSVHHIHHKATRVRVIGSTDPGAAIDDAIDLLNYTVFFVRNTRDGRV